MKLILSILFALNLFSGPDLSEIRRLYPAAANSENNALALRSKLAAVKKDDNKTLVAYKGASIALMSKFERNVFDKMDNLKEGSNLVEHAVSSEPNNIEIRMIRLSIQENIPKFINYRKNIKEDRDFMLEHYPEQSLPLKSYVKNYMLQSKSFSDKEKQSIK